ncbi:MAG: hypothetical protein KDD47_22540 [Acidobacteria bacterium]|nr:hypothetical protein [Acidobacteriota bacterium]
MTRSKRFGISLALFLALLFGISAMTASGAIISAKAQAGGHWVLSNDQSCPDPNQVCTEWELANGERKEPACCQDPSMVGSTVYHECTGGQFRQ